MNRIVHLALKVEDLEATSKFYQEVFGFREVETKKVRDHTSRHLTDGHIDFALLEYDAASDSKEKNAAGKGPCIHHFAVEVDDVEAATQQILAHGGTIAELVPKARYRTAVDD